MLSKTQKKILLFCHKHQDEFVDVTKYKKRAKTPISGDTITALLEKGYLAHLPEMSVTMHKGHMTMTYSNEYRITEEGLEQVETILQQRRQDVVAWIGAIGGILGAIGGIPAIISLFL